MEKKMKEQEEEEEKENRKIDSMNEKELYNKNQINPDIERR